MKASSIGRFAEIVALNLAGLGVIREPRIVRAIGRRDLVAEYEGQSAPKTSRLIDRALGGVLFVDEFYSLIQDRDGRLDIFGKEALDTLLARMENERHQLVVIIAGYPADIDRALDSNEGLRSRFAHRIEFQSYSPEELAQIADIVAADNDSVIADDACTEFCAAAADLSGRQVNGKTALDVAGNGRYARNVVEEAQRARDRRLDDLPDPEALTAEAIQTITAEDMKSALRAVQSRLS